MVLAVVIELVGADDVAGAVGQRVDGDAFAVAAKAGAREVRELASGIRVVRIGVPLVNAVRFVRVIHVPERIVYGDGLDFVLFANGRRAEGPEAADEDRADAAAARVDEPVLPEVTVARSRLSARRWRRRLRRGPRR